MISRYTVFVIGAGASEPYGLPLGGELRQNILERYRDQGSRLRGLLDTTAFTPRAVSNFVNGLRYSGLGSVDAFLERRPEFVDVGKAAMGMELLFSEVEDRLWQPANNWLTYLYSHMIGSSLEEFVKNKVAFITFNYDRCIEHFLFTSLKNSFGKSAEETAAVASKIQVVHLHGTLGSLSWQSQKDVIEFGDNQIDAQKMKIVPRSIKVIHEDHTADGRDIDFKIAEAMLVQARRVYLLGFGFGARNVQRIKLEHLTPHVFNGTAYGLTDRETKGCQELCGGRVNLFPQQCLDFMRQNVEFS